MGLIKAGMGATGGTLADQWKEFFYCDAMEKDVMVTKAGSVQVPVRLIKKEMTILFLMEAGLR